jgi:hypothetical protein
LQIELAEARARLAQREEALRHTDAELAWRRAVEDQLSAELQWRREVQRQQAAELRWRCEGQARLEHRLAAVQAEGEALGEEIARLRRLADGLGPVALGMTRRLQQLATRFPRAAAAGRRLLRLARPAPASKAPPPVTSSLQPRSEAS